MFSFGAEASAASYELTVLSVISSDDLKLQKM